MALGSGISYRDWVTQSQEDSNITLTTSNVMDVPLKNVATPRLRQISRYLYKGTTAGLSTYLTTIDANVANQLVDGNNFMTVGMVFIGGLKIPYYHPFKVKITIYDSSSVIIYSVTHGNYEVTPQNNKYNIVLDAIYNAKKVEVDILVVNDGTYPFTGQSIDVGRLQVGNYMEVDFSNNYNFSHGEGAKESVSVGNDSHLHFRRPRKNQKFTLELQPNSKVYGGGATWFDLSKTVSTNTDIIVLPDTTSLDALQYLGIYGKLNKPCDLQRTGGQYWTATLDVLELI